MKYIFSDKKTRKKEKQGERGIPAFLALFWKMMNVIVFKEGVLFRYYFCERTFFFVCSCPGINSIIDIGALSPTRLPLFMILV